MNANDFLRPAAWPKFDPRSVPRSFDLQAPPGTFGFRPMPAADAAPPSSLFRDVPWHGGGHQTAEPAVSLFDDANPDAINPTSVRDTRSRKRRSADAAWQTLVQPRLNAPLPHTALPDLSLDYNPFADRRQFGAHARWRWDF